MYGRVVVVGALERKQHGRGRDVRRNAEYVPRCTIGNYDGASRFVVSRVLASWQSTTHSAWLRGRRTRLAPGGGVSAAGHSALLARRDRHRPPQSMSSASS